MFALVLGAAVLAALVLATVLGFTADTRRPGPWYPGSPDRDPDQDSLTGNGRLT